MFKVVFCCVLLCLSVNISQQSVLQEVSSHYYVSLIRKPFLEALTICQEFGFKLASVPNAEIQYAINAVTNNVTWLGGIYLTYNGIFEPKWTWMNSKDEFKYTNWRQGEPNFYLDKLNCIGMMPDGSWFAGDCDTAQNFICST